MIVVYFLIALGVFLAFQFWVDSADNSSGTNTLGKSIDDNKYNILRKLFKVGLAFLSGSDGGSISLVCNGNSIQYILLCRSTFFVYRDELGISLETLLKNHVGNCPAESWRFFENTVSISKGRKKDGADELDIRTVIPVEKGTAKLYFDKLEQYLSANYPGLHIEKKGDSLSIIVAGSVKEKCKYRLNMFKVV